MAKRLRVNVNPELLRWARTSAGLDIDTAAKRIGRPVGEIEAWESGDLSPTLPQLRNASHYYKRPLAVFLLQETPAEPPLPKDFRRMSDASPDSFSPKLIALIRRARYRQSWISDWRKDNGWDPIQFVGSQRSLKKPELLATKIRALLGIPEEPSKIFKTRSEYFSWLVDRAEEVGILVIRNSTVDPEEARGFALSDQYAPFIFVNNKDTAGAKSFTLLHEIAHIHLGYSSVSNPTGTDPVKKSGVQIERFCNRVASEALIPTKSITIAFASIAEAGSDDDVARAVHKLSSLYRVSPSAIAVKLNQLGHISQDVTNIIRNDAIEAYREKQRKIKEKEGFAPWPLMYSLDNGYAFIGTIIDGLSQGDISSRDASSLLGASLKHLKEIRSYYFDHLAKSKRQRGAS